MNKRFLQRVSGMYQKKFKLRKGIKGLKRREKFEAENF